MYTPYYGAYRLPPPGEEATAAAAAPDAGGAWLASPALARATLAHCFAWVGIAEEMSLSLQLLRRELPQFFRKTGTRLLVESHMDDFHGSGRRSEVENFLKDIREKLNVKDSDIITRASTST